MPDHVIVQCFAREMQMAENVHFHLRQLQGKCKYNYFLTHMFKHVLGDQKNRLIETVLLSAHNVCFCCEIR